jgi:hypothetical protein
LHVLGTPPAFVLSQDQTLEEKLYVMLRRADKFKILAPYTIQFSKSDLINISRCM